MCTNCSEKLEIKSTIRSNLSIYLLSVTNILCKFHQFGIRKPSKSQSFLSPLTPYLSPLKNPFVDRGLLKSPVGFWECYSEMGWGITTFLPPERKVCGGPDQHSMLNVPCLMLNDTVVCGKRHACSSQAMRSSDTNDEVI